MTSRGFGTLLNVYFVLVFAGIGGMQMFGVNAGPLTNYGADLFAPPWMYFAFQSGRLRLRPLTSLVTVFVGCALWEFAQRYDFSGTPLVITRGTFDPLDLFSYAISVVAAYWIDRTVLRPRRLFPPPEPAAVNARS
jgi:hypothetical protein